MLYALSKILWALLQPSSLLGLMVVAGVALARKQSTARFGLRLATFGIVLVAVLGLTPLATILLLPLEQRFPQPVVRDGSTDFTGIVVLGGAEDPRVSAARGRLHLNEAAERITEGGLLAKRLPSARLVFAGGAGLLFIRDISGAGSVAAFWHGMGIEPERILLEEKSRNTHENALFVHNLVRPKPGDRWLLVTSAAHMPRSMGIFRRAGFDVTAYPVDFRTLGSGEDLEPFGSVPGGLRRLDDAFKEWVGLVAYWIMGRTSALFPAPA